MRSFLFAILALTVPGLVIAQEREIPKDSERISIPGCSNGRTFIVVKTPEHEPIRSDVAPGRRFRLSGSKKLLDEIKRREGTMIEVTGLILKSQLSGRGISVAGGRVRIGGAVPQDPIANPAHDPAYNQAVLDLESWRQLPESCPAK